MSTVLYASPIFGPVHSRRLGISLGINLMPADGKVCTFDCIYCECGFNAAHRPTLPRPTREEVAKALEAKLLAMRTEGLLPDVLTFAGNGEPTGHPDFEGIIDDTVALRNTYCPAARVSVLSNATLCGRESVHRALLKVDNNILKLDTVDADYIRRVNAPTGAYDVQAVVENIKSFQGHAIVQTLFMKGEGPDGQSVDNTTETYVGPWLDAIEEIAPQAVMVYTIDRETPAHNLKKATHEELDVIVARVKALGIPASASY